LVRVRDEAPGGITKFFDAPIRITSGAHAAKVIVSHADADPSGIDGISGAVFVVETYIFADAAGSRDGIAQALVKEPIGDPGPAAIDCVGELAKQAEIIGDAESVGIDGIDRPACVIVEKVGVVALFVTDRIQGAATSQPAPASPDESLEPPSGPPPPISSASTLRP